ncbi:P-loop containing nucleoside triphosphate hydrolase protein [Xylaria scruposa]|nr:P-loop containing nucleoside triphosphate hydrolase protein [Xylaria scruposa]
MDSSHTQELPGEYLQQTGGSSVKSSSVKSGSVKSGSVKSGSVKSDSVKNSSEKSSSEKSSSEHAEVSIETEPEVSTDQEEEEYSQTNSSEEDTTMICEVKWLERRYDHNDEPFFKEVGRKVEEHQQADWWKRYPFCIIGTFDHHDQSEQTQMYINSKHLRSLLHFVLHDSADSSDLQIPSPYWPLFYNYAKINEIGHSSFEGTEDAIAHLDLLLNWIRIQFRPEFRAYQAFKTQQTIFYDYLWVLFPPKSIVYNMTLGKHRAFRVESYVDFDGEKIGETKTNLLISKRDQLHSDHMEVKRLDLEANADVIRHTLIVQGKNFEKCTSQHHGQYNGIALKKSERGYDQLSIHGHVMIDCKTYLRFNPNDKVYIEKPLIYLWTASGEHEPSDRLSDDQALITNSTVRGFSFTANKFLEFFASNIQPVESALSFDALDLGPEVLTTLQGAVSHHAVNRNGISYVDSVSRQGFVCLLHGPRGAGKTLTVECVADHVKRPLYTVSSGELGTTSDALERSLNYIMNLASIWKAVLVIDDVDVFLERQVSLDFQRNAMITTFLRMLDNYEGLLFLTTTRVTAIDSAFMSRIHIPIRYETPSPYRRLEIWRDLYLAIPGAPNAPEEHLQLLAAQSFNGRQIENIVKAADDLAASGAVAIDTVILRTVAGIHSNFEQEMTREAYSRRHERNE